MEQTAPQQQPRYLRTALIITLSVVVVGFVFRLTEAGSLTPVAVPANDSMPSLASISDALVGSTYDSLGVTADKNGNVLEVAKCIMLKMTGGAPTPACPQ